MSSLLQKWSASVSVWSRTFTLLQLESPVTYSQEDTRQLIRDEHLANCNHFSVSSSLSRDFLDFFKRRRDKHNKISPHVWNNSVTARSQKLLQWIKHDIVLLPGVHHWSLILSLDHSSCLKSVSVTSRSHVRPCALPVWNSSFFQFDILGSQNFRICCWAELGALQAASEVKTRTVLHPEQKIYPTPTSYKVTTSIIPHICPRRNCLKTVHLFPNSRVGMWALHVYRSYFLLDYS